MEITCLPVERLHCGKHTDPRELLVDPISSKRPRLKSYARVPNKVSSVVLKRLFQDLQQVCFSLCSSRLQVMLWRSEYAETDRDERLLLHVCFDSHLYLEKTVSYWERVLGAFGSVFTPP